MSQIEGRRAIDHDGESGTVVRVEGDTAHVLFDYQRPSSQPKAILLEELTLLAFDFGPKV